MDTNIHTERTLCDDGGRHRRFASISQGEPRIAGPPEAGRGKDGFVPRVFRGSMALPTP